MSKLISAAMLIACSMLFSACSTSKVFSDSSSFVAIDGGRLAYQSIGEGEVLVFIGGGGAMDFRQWYYQAKDLQSNYRCLLINPRGSGESDIPKAPFTNARDIAQALEKLNIDKATIVGLSYSGGIAIDMAVLYPDLVENLIVMGPLLPGWKFSEAMVAKQEKFMEAAISGADAFVQLALFEDAYFMPSRDNKAGLRKAEMWIREAFQGEEYDETLLRHIQPRTITRIDKIKAPALLLSGELDHPDVHARLDHLRDNLKVAERVRVPGAGHMVHMEKPEAVNLLIRRFLER